MKNQICCFTGHRTIPANKHMQIQKRLEEEIARLIRQGVREFLAGGALGFDTMAALAALKLKELFPHIRLVLVLPCKAQTKSWRGDDKKIYDLIRTQADEAVYTSEHYYKGCMHVRNRYLVDNSGACVCYLTNAKGGTAYTVAYAIKRQVPVINLARD